MKKLANSFINYPQSPCARDCYQLEHKHLVPKSRSVGLDVLNYVNPPSTSLVSQGETWEFGFVGAQPA